MIDTLKNKSLNAALNHALEIISPEEVFFAEFQAKVIATLCKDIHPLSVLDVGCGDGTLTYLLSCMMPNAMIHGHDVSQEQIEIAQEWYASQNEKLSFSTTLNENGTYDVIYLANVLHHIHVNEREQLIHKLVGMLSPHGRLIVLEFNPYNIFERYRFYRDPHEIGCAMIKPSTLTTLAKKYGTIHSTYHASYAHHTSLLARVLNYIKPSTIYSLVLKK